MYCGGGAQFDNSSFRVLRQIAPAQWRRMIVDYGFGLVILAIKYDVPIDVARRTAEKLGGVGNMATTMPHVFDYLRTKPLKGYDR
jgi:hypothetical protein